MTGKLIVGVDVGGTFTDLFFLDEASGRSWIGKVPSTRGREADGFLDGVRKGAGDLSQIGTVIHGTTVGTNALLERKGGKAGVIATEGFRDVLEMRRRDRPQTWGLWGQFEPVVPRERRVEARERVLADGTVRTEVDPEEIVARARDLLARGAEAVAVTFINSYANPHNERIAAQALKSVWPNSYVNISSEILPEIREFERTSTTVLNAYLQPVVADYLDRLEADLTAQGFRGQVLIVQSNGGVMTVEMAKARPVRTALSGPAAGVIAAAHIATSAGFPNVVTGDVGGTSFDVSLIANGETALAAQTAIDFGLVVRTPMIEITTIGAGGGSIASVDRSGLLQVGPESAGAVPGPVCYGQGNDRPTLTDANVVLGRINADRPIGGVLTRLDTEAARRAIARQIGEPLGLDAVAAAEAIVRVANSRMAGAIRLVSIERGHNPRDFALMPFGGGGGLHAGALVKEVGLKAALIPPYPGVTSALGCLIADMRHDFVQTRQSHTGGDRYRSVQRRDQPHGRAGSATAGSVGRRVHRARYARRLRHALSRTDPHGVGAGCVAAGHRARCGGDTRGFRAALPRGLWPLARRHSDPPAQHSRRGGRTKAEARSCEAGAVGRQHRAGQARRQARLCQRRLARCDDLRAAGASCRRDDRGAGNPRAARHHHLCRTGPSGTR